MCGIAGVHRLTELNVPKLGSLADALLLGIENRGGDATGMLAMLDDGKVQLVREVCPATVFVRARPGIRADARTVLLHTRFATVGSRTDVRNAHPQISGGAAAIHNGTIYNADRLFARHGLPRRAQVDSEIIPALISHVGWANAAQAMSQFQGGAAFAAVHGDHPDELLLGRTQHYPLVWFASKRFVAWASTRQALENALRRTYARMPRGEWGKLDEWSLLRVNGTLSHEPVERPEPPRPPARPRPRVIISQPSGPAVSRRARRRARKAARTAPRPGAAQTQLWAPERNEREEWMQDAVTDLMTWGGLSYEDAYEEVFGTLPPDEDYGDDVYDTEAADAAVEAAVERMLAGGQVGWAHDGALEAIRRVKEGS